MSNFNKKLFSKSAILAVVSLVVVFFTAAVVPYVRTNDEVSIKAASPMPQIFEPVKWSYSTEKSSSGELELVFTAKIDKGWHLYSQDLPEGGPIATSFTFKENPNYSLIGKVTEPKAIEEEDKNFMMTLKYFANEVKFRQKVKVTGKTTIEGELEFMVCDDERCLPPDYREFKFEVEPTTIKDEGQKGAVEEKPTKKEAEGTANVIDERNDNTQGEEVVAETHKNAPANNNVQSSQGSTPPANKDIIETAKERAKAFKPEPVQLRSLTSIFIEGFLFGLIALLMPCIFPMIPMTVSFFTKQGGSRAAGFGRALLYAGSIIVIYTSLGMLVSVLLGPDAPNELATNGWLNMFFFLIFMVFAVSFLGAFEITLPSSWVNSADKASDKGGLVGIFFMAFTLSLVSFSCTGPIIGALLVEAAGGHYQGPMVGMLGFSLALALPFGIFAAFPSWLKSLPKSGGWLNSVKVVMGILEIALAMKFLSVVDLAYHWDIFTREIFIAIWIVLFATLGFYLLGKIRFSHDSETKHISVPRYFFALICFAMVVYLVPGMWGAPLKLISGYPPPIYHTEGWTLGGSSIVSNSSSENIPGVDRSKCPYGLTCFRDYDAALAYAKSQNKPLMVDFTGHGCVNCRRMEETVWIDPKIQDYLENKYVLVSLYVDDKERLPEEEQWVSEVTGRKVRTVGNKWSELQTRVYETNSQPYYVLLDNEENLIAKPRAYDSDIDAYADWLHDGLTEFEKREENKDLGSL